jgi:hypothetical protein
VPDPPEEDNQDDALEIPPGKSDTDAEKKNRCENKAPSEPLEERAIPIGSDHARQVVTHGAKSGDEDVNVLRAPAHLCERKERNQEDGRANIENKVTPTIEDPDTFRRHSGWHRRDRLGSRKSSG